MSPILGESYKGSLPTADIPKAAPNQSVALLSLTILMGHNNTYHQLTQ